MSIECEQPIEMTHVQMIGCEDEGKDDLQAS